MVRIGISIRGDNEDIEHQIVIKIQSREEINVESCVEEWLERAVAWARTWLRYPDTDITVEHKQG